MEQLDGKNVPLGIRIEERKAGLEHLKALQHDPAEAEDQPVPVQPKAVQP